MYILSLFSADPALALIWLAVILLSLSFHEFAHAFIANRLGDTTAEREGRLTLNPLAHIDPLGFIMLLAVGFGWAKPVPFNPHALKHPIRDAVVVSLAGPISNIVFALLAAVVYQLLVLIGIDPLASLLGWFLVFLVVTNLALAVFNFIPIPPLDGSRLLEALFASLRMRALGDAFTRFGPIILLVAVFLSAGVGVRIFGFVSAAAGWGCDALLSDACSMLGA